MQILPRHLRFEIHVAGKIIVEEPKPKLKRQEPDGIEEMRQMTVFHRNPDTDQPIIFDYLVKGFFKNACSAMREVPKSESSKIKAYKKKIDNLVFVAPRMIDIDMSGEMTICERPLRAQTVE